MSDGVEYVAVAAGIGYALLAVRRIRYAWVFGGLSSALLAWLAAGAGLPLQAGLQTIYVAMAIYGFWQWSEKKSEGMPAQMTSITRWPMWGHVVALIVTVLIALVLSPALAETTGARWPRLDAAVTCASLLATWMTARSVLENWLYWFAVNAASMFLYGMQGLSWVAGLYAVYFVIAIFGWRAWLAQYRRP